MLVRLQPEDESCNNDIDIPLIPPYFRFWVDTLCPPQKIVGMSMPWQFHVYNLRRLIDIRKYLYEKTQMGLLSRVVLLAVDKKYAPAHLVLDRAVKRAWSALLRPGLQYYGEFRIIQQREIDGKDHLRLLIPLKEEEYVSSTKTL